MAEIKNMAATTAAATPTIVMQITAAYHLDKKKRAQVSVPYTFEQFVRFHLSGDSCYIFK